MARRFYRGPGSEDPLTLLPSRSCDGPPRALEAARACGLTGFLDSGRGSTGAGIQRHAGRPVLRLHVLHRPEPARPHRRRPGLVEVQQMGNGRGAGVVVCSLRAGARLDPRLQSADSERPAHRTRTSVVLVAAAAQESVDDFVLADVVAHDLTADVDARRPRSRARSGNSRISNPLLRCAGMRSRSSRDTRGRRSSRPTMLTEDVDPERSGTCGARRVDRREDAVLQEKPMSSRRLASQYPPTIRRRALRSKASRRSRRPRGIDVSVAVRIEKESAEDVVDVRGVDRRRLCPRSSTPTGERLKVEPGGSIVRKRPRCGAGYPWGTPSPSS